MHTFLIPTADLSSGRACITGQDARHISRVLRLGPGNTLKLSDGQGRDSLARIVSINAGTVTLEVMDTPVTVTESPVDITVAQGMLKDAKMDMLIRHLTELGIRTWIPFFASRSIPRPDAGRLKNRIDRWQRIAGEALKQCGRSMTPDIRFPMTFDELMTDSAGHDMKISFWENSSAPLDSLRTTPSNTVKSICILMGPEGGFPENEIRTAEQHGFRTCSLGPRILRAETASMAAVTLVQNIFGDMGRNNA